ncbi:carboxylesterase family protein [Tissierella sp.]|uniref:carboxylesterase family protein n=1 Tax=Tissierella sp. TaxID=41274 RepID=UPI0028667819|nr:carboxylesterase family protein [Tissierella sp.]MDR7855329.1 carboxylesterase family protein [Tissierella sp.]
MRYKNKPCSYIFADTPCGKIKGIRKDGYSLYKGVRYATAARWEDPEIIQGWQGEYDATKSGPWCLQYNAFFEGHDTPFSKFYYDQAAEKPVINYSEDCLNLNIWVPEGVENAPVAVFVHGGSFVSGGNSATYIIGEEYCKRGIIMVSINYRLNAFANAYDEDHNGNYALKDQIVAFKWLKENIAAFGGNPDNVVGIGESAGALSLQCLLYSPQAKGLLSGAIMMSGGGNLDVLGIPAKPWFTEATWDIVKKKFGVDSIDKLKNKPSKEIYKAWTEAMATDIDLTNHSAKPIIDGDIIPKPVSELVANGEVNDIPCIFGLSSEDMFPYILYTKAIEWAVSQSEAGRSPVYAYYMDRQLPGDDAGAYHACDLWYAFGSLDLNWRPFTEIDYRITDNMIDYFAAFIKSGNPNNGELAEWTPITKENVKFINFGDEEAAMCEPPVEKLELAIQNSVKPFPGM